MRLTLRHFPIILATAILLALLIRLVTVGMSWVGVVALVLAILWFGFECARWLLSGGASPGKPAEPAKNRSEAEETEELVSLVYFLSDPRPADEEGVRQAIATALDLDADLADPASEYLVMQFSPPPESGKQDEIDRFMVRIPQGLFAVLVSPGPYIENPKEFARRSIRDKRLRNAVESHRAWLSVDLMDGSTDPGAVRDAYRIIGRILAAFAGPDCLAVYCPDLQRCNEFDLSLLDALSADDPLALFDEPTFEPVIEISDDDPAMEAAVEEAVERWPEFVAAFRDRADEDDDRYIVKAEFREGPKCEYMWVSVMEIDGDSVEGVLMNDPHELLDVHRGAVVRFDLDRLNDWIVPLPDGSHLGGFTLDVLAEGDD